MSSDKPFPVAVETEPHARGEQTESAIPGVRDLVLVVGGKGGVGKSTLAVNLAVAMAQRGLRMGVADADLYGPSVARMLGTLDMTASPLEPIERHGLVSLSVANQLPPETSVAWKGPLVSQALEQLFFEVRWGTLDCLLVDLPPGTGDVHLSVLERLHVSGAIVITGPQALAVADARRAVSLLHQQDIPVFGLTENMARFVCPCCHELQALFPAGAARQLAEERSVRYLGDLPLVAEAQACADEGVPLRLRHPQSPFSECIDEVAATVIESLSREAAWRQRTTSEAEFEQQREFWQALLDES